MEHLDNDEVFATLVGALLTLKDSKPDDRSENDRHHAVCITEMEKVLAYYKTFILEQTQFIG